MNPNITVINDNLWTVNFAYAKLNYIKEITFGERTQMTDFLTLLNDGKYLVNNQDPFCRFCLMMLPAIMKLKKWQLHTPKGFKICMRSMLPQTRKLSDADFTEYINQNKLQGHEAIYARACEWEEVRRKTKREYMKKHRRIFGVFSLLRRG